MLMFSTLSLIIFLVVTSRVVCLREKLPGRKPPIFSRLKPYVSSDFKMESFKLTQTRANCWAAGLETQQEKNEAPEPWKRCNEELSAFPVLLCSHRGAGVFLKLISRLSPQSASLVAGTIKYANINSYLMDRNRLVFWQRLYWAPVKRTCLQADSPAQCRTCKAK